MSDETLTHGDWPTTIALEKSYFTQRGIKLDCRGPIHISAKANLSFDIRIWTASHRVDPKGGYTQDVIFGGVYIEDNVWICSNVVLYDCRIGEGAIVGVGSVISGRDIPSWTVVEGNPPMVIRELRPIRHGWSGGSIIPRGWRIT